MIIMTLSCDHRVVDGARAAQFLQTLAGYMEDPLSVLD
jgi:pyruvate dehydrogenase E2 component (dihydrolipoamide acetyltransferase)